MAVRCRSCYVVRRIIVGKGKDLSRPYLKGAYALPPPHPSPHPLASVKFVTTKGKAKDSDALTALPSQVGGSGRISLSAAQL